MTIYINTFCLDKACSFCYSHTDEQLRLRVFLKTSTQAVLCILYVCIIKPSWVKYMHLHNYTCIVRKCVLSGLKWAITY